MAIERAGVNQGRADIAGAQQRLRFFNVFCAVLSPKEMREATNCTYEYLLSP